MGKSVSQDNADNHDKSTSLESVKKRPTQTGKTWKQHMEQYKRQKFRMKILIILIIVFLLIGVSLGYFYTYKQDTDGDGIPDIDDDDDDNDGMPDWWEKEHGLDPKKAEDADKDLDGDGLKNEKEYKIGTDPQRTDTDGDGIKDLHELNEGTNPNSPDSDGDGMDDGWELSNGLDPRDVSDASGDLDNDGFDQNLNGQIEESERFNNLEEYENGTDPKNNDTDADGMLDGWEAYYRDLCIDLSTTIAKYATPYYEYPYAFDPLNAVESEEDIDVNATWELAPDGLNNLQEHRLGTDPTVPDTDADGLIDGDEVRFGTRPLYYDTDGDKLPDGWEIKYGGLKIGLDPLNEDTDLDSLSDRFEDLDDDGLDNFQEFQEGTSPIIADTDGDEIPDGADIFPIDPDPGSDLDLDGLSNLKEYYYGTDPGIPDTDGDGLNDGQEILFGFHGEVVDGIYYTNDNAGIYFTNATNQDTDGDGLTDGDEILKGWHGELNDGIYHTENAGIYFTNASNIDTDLDGVLDNEELFGIFGFDTNASNSDSDLDNISDHDEISVTYGYKTNPRLIDTDKDGLNDGDEIFTDFYPFEDFNTSIYDCIENGPIDGTNPENYDTDEDGIPDGWEYLNGRATLKDLNDKKLIERYDKEYNTNYIESLKTNLDIEYVWLVNPLNESDADEDPDHDGYDSLGDGILDENDKFTNFEEFNLVFHSSNEHTDPLNWDTDGDNISDGWEIEFSEWKGPPYRYTPDPLNPYDGIEDPDDDGIEYYINNEKYLDDFTNLEEYSWGLDLDDDGIIDHGTTDPNRPDTNTNGENDYEEIWFGDADGDGLFNGWEFLFNGTPLDTEGYIPKNADLGRGEFNPYNNDSDYDGIEDRTEDIDGDIYTNIWEQGEFDFVLKNPPGGSDPTDPKSYPGNVSNRSERSKGFNFNNKGTKMANNELNYNRTNIVMASECKKIKFSF